VNRRDKLDADEVNGPEGVVLDWASIDWQVHEQNVTRLRRRIFKATRAQDYPQRPRGLLEPSAGNMPSPGLCRVDGRCVWSGGSQWCGSSA